MPGVALLIGLYMGGVGFVVIISTLLPAGSGHRSDWPVRALDLLAVVGSLGIMRWMRPGQRVFQHVSILAATAMISAAVGASGGSSTAIAYATAYYLPVVFSIAVLPLLDALAQMLLTLVIASPVLLLQPEVRAGEVMILWTSILMAATLTLWLLRALDSAQTDALTQLPNRRGLESALISAFAADTARGVYLLLDLDRFRAVNEALGEDGADQLLLQTAATWAQELPSGSTLGRDHGDVFGIVLPGVDAEQALLLVGELRQALPDGITCTVGAAVVSAGETPSMLASRTASALHTAKTEGRNSTFLHRGAGTDGRDILDGLARGEFAVFYQPIVDLATDTIIGAEALVRWNHPVHGTVPPSVFLAEAERTGAVIDLGSWVLHEACREAATWPPTPDGRQQRISVNASGRELQHPHYAAEVLSALHDSGLEATRLVIELVETDFDIESLALLANLHQLRARGVRTAIDDFGVGHSSLERVRRLKADILKIDKSFIDDITSTDQSAPLVNVALTLAEGLGMQVVAEGIEIQAQRDWLARHGCHFGQGYLLGRPSAVHAASSWGEADAPITGRHAAAPGAASAAPRER